jgi:hypothetical protein
MSAIETKELRGISAKTVVWLVMTTATIVATIIGTYNKLSIQISEIVITNQANIKVYDLRIEALERRLDALDLQINQLKQIK